MKPELAAFGKWALGTLGGLAGTVLQFFVSILIAGALLSSGEKGRAFSEKFAMRLAGPPGKDFVRLAVMTIRSVFQGVLGIAVIQAALAAIGFILIGVPGAMVWALLVMILAVMQLPPLFVVGQVIVWAFATQSRTPISACSPRPGRPRTEAPCHEPTNPVSWVAHDTQRPRRSNA